MGLYADQILPRAINLALRGGEFAGPHARPAAGLDGEVLEIGFGSGLRRRHGLVGLAEQVLEPHAHEILPVCAGIVRAGQLAAACAR